MSSDVQENPVQLDGQINAGQISAGQIRAQLEILAQDDGFRSSKRSVAFLRYVVEESLRGAAELIKERTIGMEVFGRAASYEPNLDHVVRTAASDVRKRLAIYYGDEAHRAELRISIPPGSYIPRFEIPGPAAEAEPRAELKVLEAPIEPVSTPRRLRFGWPAAVLAGLLLAAVVLGLWISLRPTPEGAFWQPIFDAHEPVLLALGDVPNGPPRAQADTAATEAQPVIAQPSNQGTVPFADAVTMARLYNTLHNHGRRILVRPVSSIAFTDLREGPVVLVGAFNNPWSLRLTGTLRFSLALDDSRQLIYIRDARNPAARTWSWGTHQPVSNIGGAGTPPLHDYALISRVRSPQTGRYLVSIGGLFVYGTQAAGEFLSDPEALKALGKAASLDPTKNLQIVLETTVTDATPGPARIVAISEE